jgi:hypothetical protein
VAMTLIQIVQQMRMKVIWFLRLTKVLLLNNYCEKGSYKWS